MIYEYKALNSNGNTVRGIAEAENMHEAIKRIRSRGLFPTKVNAREKPVVSTLTNKKFKLYSFVPQTTREKVMLVIISLQAIAFFALLMA